MSLESFKGHFFGSPVIEFSMLSFRILKTVFRIGFGFLLVAAVSFLRPNGITGICLFFCLTHEFAHLLVMKLSGATVKGIRFYGGGIGISADTDELSIFRRFAIYSAGCISNFLFTVMFYLLGENVFAAINLSIAVFNFLPVNYFDGGMILRLLLPDREKALEIVSRVTVVMLIVALFASVLTSPLTVSISQLMTLFVMVVSELIDREV